MSKEQWKSIGLNAVLLLFSAVTILPFLWMLASSFKTNAEISALAQRFLPRNPTWQNYENALNKMSFLRYFVNSLSYALVISLITIYTSAIAGFVLMMVPGVVTIIPRYSMMQALGWLNQFQALIVPSLFTSFGIFMMRQSCAAVPDEVLEAARIDGANEFYIFHRIVFPMLRNAVASMAIFQFLWAWEDYLWPYLMIRSESKQLLSIALNMFSGRFSTDYAGLFAATSIAIIPVVLCYLVFQKRFIEGIASSAVKG